MTIKPASNSIVGNLIGIGFISFGLYQVLIKPCITYGMKVPWPVALFFVPFYAIFVYRLVSAIRDRLHPERVLVREEKARRKRMEKSKQTGPIAAKIILLVMSLVFMGFGGTALSLAITKAHHARSWQETTAEVKSTTVKAHSGSRGGVLYAPEVVYTYSIDGVSYTNNQFSTFEGQSSNFNAEKAKALQYHPEQVITIYYNPDDPSESVIERATSVPFVLLGLLVLFPSVGVLMFIVWVRMVWGGRCSTREISFFNAVLKRTLPIEIKFLIFFTVLWNTTSVLWNTTSWSMFVGFFKGGLLSFKTFLSCIAAIFPWIGIGLVLAVSLFRKILSYCRAPKYVLTATCPIFKSGESIQVNYVLQGAADEVKKLKIEIVSVNRDFRSDASFSDDPLSGVVKEVFEVSDPARLASGSFAFTIPAMPPAKRRSWSLRLITFGPRNRRAKVEYTIV